MSKLVNGSNYYNEESLQEMCELLEAGTEIEIYIDCIGHSRTEYETQNYVESLKEKYGDRLIKSDKHYPKYKLKENE